MKLAAKDVHLATELGRELGLPMEASNLFAQIYRAALRQGLGDLDADAVALLTKAARVQSFATATTRRRPSLARAPAAGIPTL